MDGAPGTITANNSYEEDMAMTPEILRDDWSVNVGGLPTVKVINQTGTSVDLTKQCVSLLIFENTTTGGRWRRVTTNVFTTTTGGTELAPSGGEATATFNTDTYIPIGEHLLVLVSDPDGNPHSSDDTPSMDSLSRYITARVKFFSRGGIPEMVLEIR